MSRLLLPLILLLTTFALPVPAGEWVKHVLEDNYDNARGVFTYDLDSDGDVDVIGCCRYDNKVNWWENTGDGFVSHVIDDTFAGAWSVHAADLDGDGDGDVLSAAIEENEIAWWENLGDNQWSKHVIIEMWLSKGVYAVDIDDDGDMDVIGASSGDDVFTLHTNDGSGNFTHTVLSETDGARMVHAADLDGDTDLDIIGSSGAANRVGWFEQDGDDWIGDIIITEWEGSRAAVGADMDGDGDNDIVACARYEPQVVWWENDGTGHGWDTHIIDPDIVYPRSLHPIDMDFDGDLDVVGHSFDGNYVNWYENLGGGTEWQEHLIGQHFQGALHVRADDLDGDGDYDVVAAAGNKDQVAFWEWVESGQPVLLEVEPDQQPYEIGQEGGTVGYDAVLVNQMNFTETADLWTEVTYPNGSSLLTDNRPVTLEAGSEVVEEDITWTVDEDLAPGFYEVSVRVGTYPNGVYAEDSFVVQKLTTWVEKHGSATHVREFQLRSARPNPFNPTTTLAVFMPAPGSLRVILHDITGRAVMMLADDVYAPGVYNVTVDGRTLPSGTYLVRAEVPGRHVATQRITLVK